jgi:hypothetical protein
MGFTMYGVTFEFAEKAKHFVSYQYDNCKIYIPRSYVDERYTKMGLPYFWSYKDDGSFNMSWSNMSHEYICYGKFYSILNEDEKLEFASDIMPELEKLCRR